MPPQRARPANDDTRFDAKDKNSTFANASSKARKNGALPASNLNPTARDNAPGAGNNNGAAATAATTASNGVQPGSGGIIWSSEDVSLLHNYRTAYRLDAPPAFKEPITAAVLNAPGIGRYSPTMARRKDKRKVGKENLAMAVRKHFNALAVNESDVVVDFLYKVRHQDESFKIRFAPGKQR